MSRVVATIGCLAALLVAAAGSAQASVSSTPDPRSPVLLRNINFPGEAGWLTAAVLAGGRIVVGGDFAYIGPPTHAAGTIDLATRAVAATGPAYRRYPQAVVADGAGGYYLGGSGGVEHVLADGSADAAFAVKVTGGDARVDELARAGGTLYLAGDFTAVNGAPRAGLAAVDAAGAVTAFVPALDGPVRALVADAGAVYVGGAFTTANGAPRAGLAALAPASGSTLPFDPKAQNTASPGVDPSVEALWLAGTTLYAGGHFDHIGGADRAGLAALDTTTPGGDAEAWAPAFGDNPQAILRQGAAVYVGGGTTLDAFNTTTGASRAGFAPDVHVREALDALAFGGGRLLVGGDLFVPGASANVVSLDPDTGAADPAFPTAGSEVTSLAVTGGRVVVAGPASVGGAERAGLAALDAATLAVDPWDPDPGRAGGPVRDVLADASGVYVAGVASAFGQARNGIARFDPDTLALDAWNPAGAIDCCVETLAVAGGRLLAGGSFTTFGAVPAHHLLTLSRVDGTGATFGPGADGGAVRALLSTPGAVFAGGDFDRAGGATRMRLAGLDPATGLATTFNPGADGPVDALAALGSMLYAGGGFQHIGGAERFGLAAFDMTRPLDPPLPFAPSTQVGTTTSLATDPGSLYRVAFQVNAPMFDLADFDPVTGARRPWSPGVVGQETFLPSIVAAIGDRVLATGERDGVPGIYVFAGPPEPPPPNGGGGGGGGGSGPATPPVESGSPSTGPGPGPAKGDDGARARRELRSALRTLAGKGPRTTARLLRRGSVRLRFRAPGPGGLHLSWSGSSAGGRRAAAAKRILVARGARGYAAAATKTVVVRLTRRGRAMLRHTRRGRSVRLRSVARFHPLGGRSVRATATLRLRRV